MASTSHTSIAIATKNLIRPILEQDTIIITGSGIQHEHLLHSYLSHINNGIYFTLVLTSDTSLIERINTNFRRNLQPIMTSYSKKPRQSSSLPLLPPYTPIPFSKLRRSPISYISAHALLHGLLTKSIDPSLINHLVFCHDISIGNGTQIELILQLLRDFQFKGRLVTFLSLSHHSLITTQQNQQKTLSVVQLKQLCRILHTNCVIFLPPQYTYANYIQHRSNFGILMDLGTNSYQYITTHHRNNDINDHQDIGSTLTSSTEFPRNSTPSSTIQSPSLTAPLSSHSNSPPTHSTSSISPHTLHIIDSLFSRHLLPYIPIYTVNTPIDTLSSLIADWLQTLYNHLMTLPLMRERSHYGLPQTLPSTAEQIIQQRITLQRQQNLIASNSTIHNDNQTQHTLHHHQRPTELLHSLSYQPDIVSTLFPSQNNHNSTQSDLKNNIKFLTLPSFLYNIQESNLLTLSTLNALSTPQYIHSSTQYSMTTTTTTPSSTAPIPISLAQECHQLYMYLIRFGVKRDKSEYEKNKWMFKLFNHVYRLYISSYDNPPQIIQQDLHWIERKHLEFTQRNTTSPMAPFNSSNQSRINSNSNSNSTVASLLLSQTHKIKAHLNQCIGLPQQIRPEHYIAWDSFSLPIPFNQTPFHQLLFSNNQHFLSSATDSHQPFSHQQNRPQCPPALISSTHPLIPPPLSQSTLKLHSQPPIADLLKGFQYFHLNQRAPFRMLSSIPLVNHISDSIFTSLKLYHISQTQLTHLYSHTQHLKNTPSPDINTCTSPLISTQPKSSPHLPFSIPFGHSFAQPQNSFVMFFHNSSSLDQFHELLTTPSTISISTHLCDSDRIPDHLPHSTPNPSPFNTISSPPSSSQLPHAQVDLVEESQHPFPTQSQQLQSHNSASTSSPQPLSPHTHRTHIPPQSTFITTFRLNKPIDANSLHFPTSFPLSPSSNHSHSITSRNPSFLDSQRLPEMSPTIKDQLRSGAFIDSNLFLATRFSVRLWLNTLNEKVRHYKQYLQLCQQYDNRIYATYSAFIGSPEQAQVMEFFTNQQKFAEERRKIDPTYQLKRNPIDIARFPLYKAFLDAVRTDFPSLGILVKTFHLTSTPSLTTMYDICRDQMERQQAQVGVGGTFLQHNQTTASSSAMGLSSQNPSKRASLYSLKKDDKKSIPDHRYPVTLNQLCHFSPIELFVARTDIKTIVERKGCFTHPADFFIYFSPYARHRLYKKYKIVDSLNFHNTKPTLELRLGQSYEHVVQNALFFELWTFYQTKMYTLQPQSAENSEKQAKPMVYSQFPRAFHPHSFFTTLGSKSISSHSSTTIPQSLLSQLQSTNQNNPQTQALDQPLPSQSISALLSAESGPLQITPHRDNSKDNNLNVTPPKPTIPLLNMCDIFRSIAQHIPPIPALSQRPSLPPPGTQTQLSLKQSTTSSPNLESPSPAPFTFLNPTPSSFYEHLFTLTQPDRTQSESAQLHHLNGDDDDDNLAQRSVSHSSSQSNPLSTLHDKNNLFQANFHPNYSDFLFTTPHFLNPTEYFGSVELATMYDSIASAQQSSMLYNHTTAHKSQQHSKHPPNQLHSPPYTTPSMAKHTSTSTLYNTKYSPDYFTASEKDVQFRHELTNSLFDVFIDGACSNYPQPMTENVNIARQVATITSEDSQPIKSPHFAEIRYPNQAIYLSNPFERAYKAMESVDVRFQTHNSRSPSQRLTDNGSVSTTESLRDCSQLTDMFTSNQALSDTAQIQSLSQPTFDSHMPIDAENSSPRTPLRGHSSQQYDHTATISTELAITHQPQGLLQFFTPKPSQTDAGVKEGKGEPKKRARAGSKDEVIDLTALQSLTTTSPTLSESQLRAESVTASGFFSQPELSLLENIFEQLSRILPPVQSSINSNASRPSASPRHDISQNKPQHPIELSTSFKTTYQIDLSSFIFHDSLFSTELAEYNPYSCAPPPTVSPELMPSHKTNFLHSNISPPISVPFSTTSILYDELKQLPIKSAGSKSTTKPKQDSNAAKFAEIDVNIRSKGHSVELERVQFAELLSAYPMNNAMLSPHPLHALPSQLQSNSIQTSSISSHLFEQLPPPVTKSKPILSMMNQQDPNFTPLQPASKQTGQNPARKAQSVSTKPTAQTTPSTLIAPRSKFPINVIFEAFSHRIQVPELISTLEHPTRYLINSINPLHPSPDRHQTSPQQLFSYTPQSSNTFTQLTYSSGYIDRMKIIISLYSKIWYLIQLQLKTASTPLNFHSICESLDSRPHQLPQAQSQSTSSIFALFARASSPFHDMTMSDSLYPQTPVSTTSTLTSLLSTTPTNSVNNNNNFGLSIPNQLQKQQKQQRRQFRTELTSEFFSERRLQGEPGSTQNEDDVDDSYDLLSDDEDDSQLQLSQYDYYSDFEDDYNPFLQQDTLTFDSDQTIQDPSFNTKSDTLPVDTTPPSHPISFTVDDTTAIGVINFLLFLAHLIAQPHCGLPMPMYLNKNYFFNVFASTNSSYLPLVLHPNASTSTHANHDQLLSPSQSSSDTTHSPPSNGFTQHYRSYLPQIIPARITLVSTYQLTRPNSLLHSYAYQSSKILLHHLSHGQWSVFNDLLNTMLFHRVYERVCLSLGAYTDVTGRLIFPATLPLFDKHTNYNSYLTNTLFAQRTAPSSTSHYANLNQTATRDDLLPLDIQSTQPCPSTQIPQQHCGDSLYPRPLFNTPRLCDLSTTLHKTISSCLRSQTGLYYPSIDNNTVFRFHEQQESRNFQEFQRQLEDFQITKTSEDVLREFRQKREREIEALRLLRDGLVDTFQTTKHAHPESAAKLAKMQREIQDVEAKITKMLANQPISSDYTGTQHKLLIDAAKDDGEGIYTSYGGQSKTFELLKEMSDARKKLKLPPELTQVHIDSRELRSELLVQLYKLKMSPTVSTMTTADYVLLNGLIGIERKSPSDFASSLNGGRLYEQFFRLSALFARPLLLIEWGSRDELKLYNVGRISNHRALFHNGFTDTKGSTMFPSSLLAKSLMLIYVFPKVRWVWSNSAVNSCKLFFLLQNQFYKEHPTNSSVLIDIDEDGEAGERNDPFDHDGGDGDENDGIGPSSQMQPSSQTLDLSTQVQLSPQHQPPTTTPNTMASLVGISTQSTPVDTPIDESNLADKKRKQPQPLSTSISTSATNSSSTQQLSQNPHEDSKTLLCDQVYETLSRFPGVHQGNIYKILTKFPNLREFCLAPKATLEQVMGKYESNQFIRFLNANVNE